MSVSTLMMVIMLMIVGGSSAQRNFDYCHASDYDPYIRFGTKTPYEFVKGRETNQHIVPYCTPVQFWSYNKFGTSLPNAETMLELAGLSKVRDEIINNYEQRRTAPDHGRLCDQDIDNLKQWRWNNNFTSHFAEDINVQGFDDIRYMAKRWQTKFPSLFPIQYSERDFEFKYTNKRSSMDSWRAFTAGIFGREPYMNQQATPNNSLLQPFASCDRQSDSEAGMQQVEVFKRKEEFQNMLTNVSNHLGYKYTLPEKTILSIYDMCRYDKAWEIRRNSPWCAAFSKSQLQLLEYLEDLEYYYKVGYGNEASKRMGCPPLKDLYSKFRKAVENPDPNQPKVSVYFTDSPNLLLLASAIGIGDDNVPLTADNYHSPQMQRRKWRTSVIEPFGANIAAVLYKCDQGEKNKVMFFMNENPVDLNECSVGLCSWDWFKNKYGRQTDDCSSNVCEGNSASIKSSYKMLFTLISTIVLVLSFK